MRARAQNTDEILRKLKAAAGKPMTEEDVHNQKVSFIMGMVRNAKREEVEAELRKSAGIPTERRPRFKHEIGETVVRQ